MQPRILLAHVPWRDISQLLRWLATAGATSLTVPRRYIQIARSACHLAPLLPFFSPLNAPYGRLLIRILLSIPFFPVSSLSSVLSENSVRRASSLFRHAREPLISADFARRVDPWNPCSCLSPAPTRAGSFHPFLSPSVYILPSAFSLLLSFLSRFFCFHSTEAFAGASPRANFRDEERSLSSVIFGHAFNRSWCNECD